jgi:hypothetical protein
MSESRRPRGALRRLLGKLLFAGVGVAAGPAAADRGEPGDVIADTDDVVRDVVDAVLDLAGDPPDPRAGGHVLAVVLEHLHPLDATRTVATAALSPRPEVRCALGEALTWRFALVGAGMVIDQLARDPEPAVRLAAARAAHARRADGGDDGVLARLCHDPDPTVAAAAILALHGR